MKATSTEAIQSRHALPGTYGLLGRQAGADKSDDRRVTCKFHRSPIRLIIDIRQLNQNCNHYLLDKVWILGILFTGDLVDVTPHSAH